VVAAGAVFVGVTVFLAFLFALLADFGGVLVRVQAALELLGPALLLGRRVALALLLAQGLELLLHRIVAWPGWLIRVSHRGLSRESVGS
jgi:hypothetical protein